MAAKRCSICAVNHPVSKKSNNANFPHSGGLWTHCISCGGALEYIANAEPDEDFAELEAREEAEAAQRKADAVNRQMFEDYYIQHSVSKALTDEGVLTYESMQILGIAHGGESN